MTPPSLIVCVVLCLGAASAWNDCAFPQVGWFALDEGAGISYAYALAAMNGNMYSGGYAKGNFAFVGVTDSDSPDIFPNPSASIYGDTTSNVQSLYVAEVSSTGSMTKSWLLRGSAIQIGAIGHGRQTNSIDAHSGMHAMLDKKHIAVKGGFRQLLTLPDGTVWSSATRSNTNDQVPFVMSIDVSSTQGIGAGTTGWAKLVDDNHAGGAQVYSVDGDTGGNMIVTYEGCGGYNATATSYDAYGRPVQGATTNCKKYVMKLAAANGAEMWKHEVPTTLSSCRAITDGSFFCGWSMTASAGNLSFGNGVMVVSESQRVGIIKYNANGIAQWAKATASTSFGDLAVSKTGTLLAVVGSPGGRGAAILSRIDTSSGNEGIVLWTDAGGVGSHGFRGVEVTDDDKEVFAFGQLTGTETLTDANARSTTLRSRGSYEVFVVAYNAADGSGKYAMDGGGTGMEYFFAMASDPDTHDIYLGGTSRSEYITWGNVKRKNVMYNGDPGKNNPDTASAVGSSKAFAVKLKSALTLPSCLKTCNSAFPLQASDVKSDHCYIDRHCYPDGTFSPYSGFQCLKCNAASNPIKWGPPDTSNACFINGACVASGARKQVPSGRSYVDDPCYECDPSVNKTDYSPVAGCNLPRTFKAGVYKEDGSQLMSLAAMTTGQKALQNAIASMQTLNTDLKSNISSFKTDKTILQTNLANSQKQVASMQTVNTGLSSEVASLKTDKTALQTNLNNVQAQLGSATTNHQKQIANLQAQVNSANASKDSISDELAILLIVILSVMLLIALFTSCSLIYKQKRAVPVPAVATPYVVGSPQESTAGQNPKEDEV